MLKQLVSYKSNDTVKIVLGVISILLWFVFIYELVFLTGTGRQGFISPNILLVFAFLLIFSFFHNMKHVFTGKKIYLLVAGLLCFTIGTRVKSYTSIALICVILFSLTLIYTDKTGNSFGYVKSSGNDTGITSQPLYPQQYIKYPNQSNQF